ncbi:MAG: hypothetical protein H6R10_1063 [Rhodocyclaceae bacterium]|nr:hypothetical protein [Rhodocyclaceae bacterium]
MTPSDLPSIEKCQSDPAGLDFDGLRRAGIDLLQALCGQGWTDYNLHDPGVTLLEQLCYGLTDLVYRTGFATEDYLFGPQGRIDGPGLALLPPEEALSCHPLTPEDYRKLFADALPEVRNVWVEPAGDGAPPGLLDIHFQLAEQLQDDEDRVREVLARATALYHRHRNLCEDIGKIGVAGHQDYRLAGEIEIASGRPARDILADIYFACLAAISPPIPQRPYHDLADGDLDQLFDGPLGQHGHIDARAFRPWNGATLSELVRTVGAVDGVRRIATLELLDGDGQPCQAAVGDPTAKRAPRLAIPRRPAELHLKLRLAGQERAVALPEFLDRLERLAFAADSRRHGRSSSEPISPLPTGSAPVFADYTSVQHHLPPIYGLGQYGLPESAPALRRAQARQLQAYLLLFDQIMANFLQGLDELPRLFSLDETLDRTYFHRVLDNRDLPGIEALYPAGRDGIEAGLRRILDEVDDFGDRRSRALDFLLALHGEKFSQHTLRNFSTGAGRPLDEELLRDKIAYLRRAPDLNARRMAAFDYLRGPAAGNIPALAEKLGLLLRLNPQARHPVTVQIRARGFRIVRDQDFCREAGIESVPALPGAEEAVPLPPEVAAGEAAFLAKGVLCPALMSGGGDPARYRVVADGQGFRLYFALEDGQAYGLLSRHGDKREAVAEANRLSRAIEALMAETLGFHLVEHILLRPGDASLQGSDDGFHACRASAVFPAWSSRLANPEFRKVVEETVFLCSPAHVQVDVLWLDYDQMAMFERLYWQWLRQKSAPAASAADDVARLLALFLRRCRDKAGEGTRRV